MIQFRRMENEVLVRDTIAHPAIYRHVADDLAPPRKQFRPLMHESMLYAGAYLGEEYLGLFMFAPSNSICWDVHTCLLPVAWGEHAIPAAQGVVAWVFENTRCRRITTSIPAYNRLAIRLAVFAGMEMAGTNHSSWLKGGKLHDQVLMGISKGDVCLQR